jgi:hypothetical protein
MEEELSFDCDLHLSPPGPGLATLIMKFLQMLGAPENKALEAVMGKVIRKASEGCYPSLLVSLRPLSLSPN